MFEELVSAAYAMGPPPGGGQGAPPGNPLLSFLPLIVIFAIFYFLLIRPQQKRQKEHKKFLEALKKGDEVITNGGIYGRVVDIDGNVVSLEVAKNVVIRVAKSQIAGRPTPETK